jgi:N-acetylglucosamine kinase-like BadF-type ATPase
MDYANVSRSPSSRRVYAAKAPAFDFFIGVDGGGSKTVALVADSDGRVKGRGEAGTSNHHVAGWRGGFQAVLQAVQMAQKEAGCLDRPALAVCMGMAGADTKDDHARTASWLKRQGLGRSSLVVNDGALLLAATKQSEGVAVVSGTGSIAWGQSSNGKQARAGGWGHLIGDEGSGYALSIQALRHTVAAADGRVTSDALSKAVLRFYGLKTAQGLLPFVYGPQIAKADIAKLAPVVFKLAARGDAVANALVDDAAASLATLVSCVVRELGLRKPALAFGGSLLVKQKVLRDRLLARLPKRSGLVTLVTEPAEGALHLAAEASKSSA